MTLVEQSTDIASMSENDAIEITALIKQTGSILWSQVVRAFQGRAWAALGYDSWDAYCDAEFDGARIKLPREERTMIVASLADAGMSVPAIASAIGVSQRTVKYDRAQGVQDCTPSPAADPDDEIVDAEVIDEPAPMPRQVTGTDGKTYNITPKPIVDRRPPLTDAANSAGMKLRNRVELLEDLIGDDRFTTHRQALAPMLRSHLTYAIDACGRMLAEIDN